MNELELKKLLNQCLTKKECIDLIYNQIASDKQWKRSLEEYIYDVLDEKEDILFEKSEEILKNNSSIDFLEKKTEFNNLCNQLKKINRCKMKISNGV